MRLRNKKIKVQHSIITDLFPLLHKISQLDIVKTIVPGRIKPVAGNYPKIILEYTAPTDSGIKCIAKSSRSVQEVFIVTDFVEELLGYLREEKIIG
jgi:hypothetical protein